MCDCEIKDAYIPKDYHTGRSKGFGFVEFFNEEDRSMALERAEG